MKNLNTFAAIIIMVVLAVAANTATAQSVDNLLGVTADTVKKVSIFNNPTVVAESTVPKGSKTIEKSKVDIWDGNKFLFTKVRGVGTDDGFGGEMSFGLYYHGWSFSTVGRYIQDRSGFGLGIEKDILGKSESLCFLSADILFGAFQQNAGIRSDINVKDLEGGLYHGYITKKLRPQVEAGLNLQFRLSNKVFLTASGGGIWRCCDGDKLSLDSQINFPNAEVLRSAMDAANKEFGWKFSIGVTIRLK